MSIPSYRRRFTGTIALLFFSLSLTAFAQPGATVSGTVTDPEAAAIPAATVILFGRDASTKQTGTTDVQGAYRFAGVAAGVYLLEVRADGFAGNTTDPIEVAAGAELVRDVSLEVARLRTEVVVTASGTPLLFEEVAKATDSVGLEEINLRGEHSVAESLRLIPGFRVRQLGGPGGQTTVQVRGLRSHDTAFLVDGLRLRDSADPQGSITPYFQDLIVTAPERAEVMRGSGSSLYGSHAIGGVVNYVSDQGGGQPHGEFVGEGGGLGMFRGLAKGSGGALGNRLLYSGGVTHFNVTNGLDGVNPYRNTSGQGFLRYSFAPGITLSGRALLSNAYGRVYDSPYVDDLLAPNLPASGIVAGVPLPDEQRRRIEQGLPWTPGNATYVPSLNDGDSNRAASFANIATIFTHQLSPSFSYRASYQFLDTNRRFDDGPAGVRFEPLYNNSSAFDGRIHVAEIRADLKAGHHMLISGGYEFEDESYDNLNTDEDPDPAARVFNGTTIKQRSHSLFVQDQISFLNRNLQIALSGRMQKFSPRDPEFLGGASPYAGIPVEDPKTAWVGDASVMYLFRATGTKWRAHAGNSYRAASLFERYGTSFFFGAFSPFGDPRLRPERAISVDTGLDQFLWNSRLKLSATYFYTRLQETIIFDFSGLIPPDDPFQRFGGYVNTAGGLARGVELSVNAKPTSSTTINASYTFSKSDLGRAWDFESLMNRSRGVSGNMFTLLVSQWIGRRVNFTFDLFAADAYPEAFSANFATRAFTMDGFVKADLTGKYVLPLTDTRSLEFFGRLDNLFNRQLYDQGYRSQTLWATAGARVIF